MIYCQNEEGENKCKFNWFHTKCVGLEHLTNEDIE
jgi:hypothetical protein